MVDVQFEEYKCVVKVVDEAGTHHALNLFKLYEKIEVDKSLFKFTDKRISITLKKWLETKWTELIKGKGDKK